MVGTGEQVAVRAIDTATMHRQRLLHRLRGLEAAQAFLRDLPRREPDHPAAPRACTDILYGRTPAASGRTPHPDPRLPLIG